MCLVIRPNWNAISFHATFFFMQSFSSYNFFLQVLKLYNSLEGTSHSSSAGNQRLAHDKISSSNQAKLAYEAKVFIHCFVRTKKTSVWSLPWETLINVKIKTLQLYISGKQTHCFPWSESSSAYCLLTLKKKLKSWRFVSIHIRLKVSVLFLSLKFLFSLYYTNVRQS